MSMPTWHEVEDRLRAIDAPTSAAEAHGLLCGLLAMAAPAAQAVWLERAAGTDNATAPLDVLVEETARQLDDSAFAFELLLPGDDDVGLEARTDAVGQWCTGFASGIGLSGRAASELGQDAREFLEDVTRIAQAEVTTDEDDEAAFAEVVEYLRVGTLLVRTEAAGAAGGG
ncbi:MAG: UPF0149 family protein [Halofilum sp. (in: g-proteobacteria)]|nr:UPF0149 family protein [Halofilum sp. (in: g-proteobacteria)]